MTKRRRRKRRIDKGVILVIALAAILAGAILFGALKLLFSITKSEKSEKEQTVVAMESEETAEDESSNENEEELQEDVQDPQSEMNTVDIEDGAETEIAKILTAENAQETSDTTIGIDVAKYQGTIDWTEVAASGIDFAMVRVGYRTQNSGEIKADTNAKYNMQEATANGLKVGAYFFSTAISEEEAIEEHDDSKGLYSFPLLLTMMKVAIPSIIQQSIVSISMLAVQALVNPYGSSVVAGYAAAQKIDSVAIMPMQAVGNAMSTFTAQNIGANKHERVREGYRASYSLIFLINVLIWSLIRFEAEPLLSLFLEAGSGSVAMHTGTDYLHLVSMTYFLLGLLMVTGSVLRGAGDLKWFMINSVINVASRIVCAYGLNGVLGVASVWISVPIGWLCGYACHFYRYRQRKWMEKHLI